MLLSDENEGCCGEVVRQYSQAGFTIYATLCAIASVTVLVLEADSNGTDAPRAHATTGVLAAVGSIWMAWGLGTAALRDGVMGAVSRLQDLLAACAVATVATTTAASSDGVGEQSPLIAAAVLAFLASVIAATAPAIASALRANDSVF